jgi:hypothetical protein
MDDVDVEQQAHSNSAQLQAGQQLGVVNGQDRFLHSLDFHEDDRLNAKIDPVGGVDFEIVIDDWKRELRLEE